MLPDEKIGCHRTGFQMSCYDGVTKHKCQLWCHVSGYDHTDQPIDVYGCSDGLEIKLLHEVAKEVRHATASTDKVANEVKIAGDAAAVRDAMLINGIKASLPMLMMKENMDGRHIAQLNRDPSGPDRCVAGDSEVQS